MLSCDREDLICQFVCSGQVGRGSGVLPESIEDNDQLLSVVELLR